MATLYTITGHPLLSPKFESKDPDYQTGLQVIAETLLKLKAPAYTNADDVEAIGYAIVRQINFLLEQDIEPEVKESISNSQPGMVTRYQARWLSPAAYNIVAHITGRVQVRFEVPGAGT